MCLNWGVPAGVSKKFWTQKGSPLRSVELRKQRVAQNPQHFSEMVTWGFCCLNFFIAQRRNKNLLKDLKRITHIAISSQDIVPVDTLKAKSWELRKNIFLWVMRISRNQIGLKWMRKDISPHVLANNCLGSRRIFPFLATYHYPWRLFVPLRDGRSHKTNSCLIQWDNCCYTRVLKSYSLNFPSYYWILTTFALLMQCMKKGMRKPCVTKQYTVFWFFKQHGIQHCWGILTTFWTYEFHWVILHWIKIIIHHSLDFVYSQIGKLYTLGGQHVFWHCYGKDLHKENVTSLPPSHDKNLRTQ